MSRSNKHEHPKESSSNNPHKKAKKVPYKVVECWDWKRGSCPRGEKCTFLHGSETKANPIASETSATTASTSKNNHKAITCKFFQAGNCLRGDSCPYSHDTPSQIPCKYYVARGFCNNQNQCKYAHIPVEEGVRKTISEEFNSYQKYSKSVKTEEFPKPKDSSSPPIIVKSSRVEFASLPPPIQLQVFHIPSFFAPHSEQSCEEKVWIQEAIARYKPFSSPF